MLVADEDQADADGPDHEGKEGQEALTEGELGVVHLWQAVRGTDVQVDATPKARMRPTKESSTGVKPMMRAPIMTLSPLRKLNARAFGTDRFATGPVKMTKSAIS